jgi:aerobic carbon-monoxide dehydrogenase medium subunit
VKPGPLTFVRAETVEHVLDLLASHGDETRVIAGGQSLMPLLNMRLAQPSVVVDIGRLDELNTMSQSDTVHVGALVRHRHLEQWSAPGPTAALLRAAGSHIGHLPIRIRGTFGGSLAHGDPAAEWCLICHVLDAQVHLRSASSSRSIPASEFFEGFLTTAKSDDELVIGAELPRLPHDTRVGFSEYSRRAGDFALALAAAVCRIVDDQVADARVAVGDGSTIPARSRAAEAALIGAQAGDAEAVETAVQEAVAVLEPHATPHCSPPTRRRLASACVRRAVRQAMVGAATGAGSWSA